MITSVRFRNFKALRDTTLPLGRFTLIVGPNGSGKSTVLQALLALRSSVVQGDDFPKYATAGLSPEKDGPVQVTVLWDGVLAGFTTTAEWPATPGSWRKVEHRPEIQDASCTNLTAVRVYSLDASAIAAPVLLRPRIELEPNGAGLAGVLDRLRDSHPERFEALNVELARWIPEFDRILFETPAEGNRTISLRKHAGGHPIHARDLSQGTLLALALLTLAYLPDPPAIMGLEEPDRGIHPRLLREVRDALYRLSYPEKFGEKRDSVQVVATTHSPSFLDLFREHPEEIVIANKVGGEVRFERLAERDDITEILEDTPLGDAWYSGILGGVPANT